MIKAEQFEKAIELINASNKVVLTSHTRPDGDACGSVAAMCEALKMLGKEARPVFLSPLPKWYEGMFEARPTVVGEDITAEQMQGGYFDECDLAIIADTNSRVQLPNFAEWLGKAKKRVLVLDHHVTSDRLGTVELVDTKAAAAGEIVLDLFRYAKWPISEKTAEALFISLSTDTGWFRFSNTDSRAYRDAAELIDAGAKPAKVYKDMFQNFSVERMKLMTIMLSRMEFYFENRCAVQYLRWEDFEKTGATGRDTENLIDECRRVSSVEAAVLLVEQKDGNFRCSLRSRDGLDMQKIAMKYGGGGHKAAAGVTLEGPVEKAKELLLKEVKEQLESKRA